MTTSTRGNNDTIVRSGSRGEETKPSFKTSELVVYVLAVVGVLIASAVTGDAGTASGDDRPPRLPRPPRPPSPLPTSA